MKRWATFVLIFFTVAAFATILIDTTQQINTPSPLTDGTLYSQPYDFAGVTNAFYIGGTNIGADDFVLTSGGNVNQLELWFLIYAPSFDLDVFVYEDNSDSPGSIFWQGTIPAAQITSVDTGDDLWAQDIYQVTVDLGSGFTITDGNKYWLGIQSSEVDEVYWLTAEPIWADFAYWSYDDGVTWAFPDGVECECFFNLYGETSLTQETWGKIKTEF